MPRSLHPVRASIQYLHVCNHDAWNPSAAVLLSLPSQACPSCHLVRACVAGCVDCASHCMCMEAGADASKAGWGMDPNSACPDIVSPLHIATMGGCGFTGQRVHARAHIAV